MLIGCAYTISGFELSTISEMPINKASRFSGCVHSGRLLYNPSLGAFSGQETQKGALLLLNRVVLQRPLGVCAPIGLKVRVRFSAGLRRSGFWGSRCSCAESPGPRSQRRNLRSE